MSPRPAWLLLLIMACQDPRGAERSPATAPPAVGDTGPLDALSRRFGRLRARMHRRGYTEVLRLDRMFVLEGHGVATPVHLRRTGCTTFVALPGGRVRDLSLVMYDGEGVEVASDSVLGEGALVHVCPQPSVDDALSATYYLVVRAIEGAGAVLIGTFVSRSGEGTGFDGLFDGLLAPRVPFQGVEEKLAISRATLRSRGLLPLSDPVLDSTAEGEGVRFSGELEPGRCYVAVARGDEGLADVDLVLFDPAGVEVARDIRGDAEPTLEYCPGTEGRYRFEATAFEGAGAIGLMVLGGPAPAGGGEPGAQAQATPSPEAPASSDGDSMAALNVEAALLIERGYAPPAYITRDGWISPGEVRRDEVPLGSGCSLVLGVAGRAETDLDLYLSASTGGSVDRDTGVHPMARVGACLAQPGVLTVTVKAYGRRGTYALAVLAAPPEISDVRALRLEEATAGYRARGYSVVDRSEREIEQGGGFRMPLRVQMDHCAAVAAAGDVGVSDVDLILRNSQGQVVASASGPEPYAAVGHCVEQSAETMSIQVLVYRGRGSVTVEKLEGAQ